MNIAVVTRNLSAGGAERVVVQLLDEWVKTNNCELILLDNCDDFYKVDSRVKITRIGQKNNNPLLDKVSSYAMVRKKIMADNVDIVLSMPEEIGIYVIGAMLFTNLPIVVSERNNPYVMPYKKITRALRKLLYPFAKGFIFQTQNAANFFSDSIQKKSIVLSNPLDLSRIPSMHIGPKDKVIVSAGRFEKQKNFKLLIDAFSIFVRNHDDYKLIIYGEGSLRQELSDYARLILGDGKFSFPGKNDDLLNQIKDCEVFVLSSDFEGSPNVLIEAMSMGMAVVSTDYAPGGVETIIDNNKNGLIVQSNNHEILASAITRLVEEKDLAERFRHEATEIRKQFDSSIVSKQWLDYLRSMV